MNILFYTAYKPSSNKGGTERTTITLARGLKKYYGWDCYAAYVVEDNSVKEDCFKNIRRLDEKNDIVQLTDLIGEWKVDCFIDQGDLRIAALFDRSKIKRNCKLILAYHFEPKWDEKFFTKKNLRDSIKTDSFEKKIKSIIKLIFFDLYFRARYISKLQDYCEKSYLNVDNVVLLSQGYFQDYLKWANVDNHDKQKLIAIPNALTYVSDYEERRIKDKEKRVLIVSRLDEKQKRLTLALDIWKEVKNNHVADNWVLDIVGSGIDELLYRNKVKNDSIPDVTFYGRREPKEFYERACIFLMTSRSEGWPLTIAEAMQHGVVPVVYDTVAAFKEMINPGENGELIKDGDSKRFSEEVLELMKDMDKRNRMAGRAIQYCKRFELSEIVKKWYALICGDKDNSLVRDE